MNETGLPLLNILFEKMLLRCRENVNMEIKYLECFPSLVKINLILMVRSKKSGVSRLYNCCDGWKVSAKLRRRYILATQLLFRWSMEHLNILTVESVKLLLVRRNMGVNVGLVHEKRCAVTCFRGRGMVSLNIYLSTNTNKELFHIHTNACGDAETQQDEKMT